MAATCPLRSQPLAVHPTESEQRQHAGPRRDKRGTVFPVPAPEQFESDRAGQDRKDDPNCLLSPLCTQPGPIQPEDLDGGERDKGRHEGRPHTRASVVAGARSGPRSSQVPATATTSRICRPARNRLLVFPPTATELPTMGGSTCGMSTEGRVGIAIGT